MYQDVGPGEGQEQFADLSGPSAVTDIWVVPYQPGDWGVHGEAIAEVERLCFPRHHYSPEDLELEFESPASTAVLLLDDDDRVIGYSLATELNPILAQVVGTAIHPDFQGQGLVADLKRELETVLVEDGKTVMLQECIVENGYAKKAFDFYARSGRLIYTESLHTEEFGQQLMMIVRLEAPDAGLD